MSLIQKTIEVIRKTRKGKVVKQVREHYLRDDIWCGLRQCCECAHTSSDRCVDLKSIVNLNGSAELILLLLDTDAILKQIDVLEYYNINVAPYVGTRFVAFQSVLQEVIFSTYCHFATSYDRFRLGTEKYT